MSQVNPIVLAVDVLNDANTVDYTFSQFDNFSNRTVYIGEDHTIAGHDTLTLYRTFPKPAGNFCGMAKVAVKFSQAISVYGVDGVSTISAPLILEVSASIPVGATLAQQLVARQRGVALLDRDDVMVPLFNQQAI